MASRRRAPSLSLLFRAPDATWETVPLALPDGTSEDLRLAVMHEPHPSVNKH